MTAFRRPPHRTGRRRAGARCSRRSASTRSTRSIDAAVPRAIREREVLAFGAPKSETEMLAELRDLAARNEVLTSLIGLGYHDTITPPVILRNVLENPAWYTAYTPYQPEISQGRLEALLNFQTMVADLTGMDLANASLLDEGTAAAEAMAMLQRLNPKAGNTLLRRRRLPSADDRGRADARRAARHRGRRRGRGPTCRRRASSACSCSTRGAAVRCATTARPWTPRTRTGALVAVAADLLALTLVVPPGEFGADVVSAARSASACRSASADRTPRSSRPATSTSARCRAGSSACRSTRRAEPRTGSRCRRASSTSVARRRRATSAPRRCCSR